MANDIKHDSLIEHVNGALFNGKFLVISIGCDSREDAHNWAQSLGMENADFEDGTVRVSRMGVNSVELNCGDVANVILSWQGDRPDNATEVDEEDDDNNDEE